MLFSRAMLISSRRVLPFAFMLAVVVGGCASANVAPLRLRGHWEPVRSGDTLESVAARHGAESSAVAELNGVATSKDLGARGELFVPAPDGTPPGDGRTPQPPVIAPISAVSLAQFEGECIGESCLAWPLDGELLARFVLGGKAPHDGLDIAAAAGTQIRAARSGKVLYSGDGIKGYGNMVILKHEGGLVTVYAHAEQNLVKEGDEVAQGDVVARVGSTGGARQPHLHFEVRQREEPVDPARYLPKRNNDGRESR